jgi:uncharacterized RDD family membrane protein YckC
MFTRRNSVVEMPADGPVTMGGGALAYGGFWARFAALIIDNAILTIVAMVLIIAASLVDESLAALASFAYFIGALLYWPLMEASARQATLGKQLLGLQVTDGAGERLSFVRSLLRNIAKIISAIPLYIGFLLAAFTSRKQALHDIITNCMVVRSGPSNFLKAAGATVVAIIITAAGGYYYVTNIYHAEMEKAEKAMKAAQKARPAPKPAVEQVQAPGQTFPAGKPAPAAAEPAPVKPAAAPAAPAPAPKGAATAQVKEPAKPAAAPAPAPAKPATAQIKPAPAKPAAAPAAPAKQASPAPMKVAAAPAAKVKHAPKPEPVMAAATVEAPKEPREAPAPRPAPPPVEVTRVPAATAGPTPTYNDVMTAVMYRDQAGATQLLNLGWWPDRPDSNGVTPLMAAAMNGDAAMTELLLSRGANPLLRGPAGSTLDYANRGGNTTVVELLRKAGAR